MKVPDTRFICITGIAVGIHVYADSPAKSQLQSHQNRVHRFSYKIRYTVPQDHG